MPPPLPDAERRTLQWASGRRKSPGKPTRAEVVATLRRLASEDPGLVSLFDARAVASERHLLSAWAHLGRARTRGESRLRDRGAEFALYVAGDDQLPRALGKVGVTDTTEEFLLVAEKPRTPRELLAQFSLVEDPSLFPRPVEASVLDRLGIENAERSTVPPECWEGLILERVALLDLSAGRSGEPTAKKH